MCSTFDFFLKREYWKVNACQTVHEKYSHFEHKIPEHRNPKDIGSNFSCKWEGWRQELSSSISSTHSLPGSSPHHLLFPTQSTQVGQKRWKECIQMTAWLQQLDMFIAQLSGPTALSILNVCSFQNLCQKSIPPFGDGCTYCYPFQCQTGSIIGSLQKQYSSYI